MEHHQHGHFEHLLMSGNVFDVATFAAIVWFSFLMSWHCGVMCGPLVCSRMILHKGSTWFDIVLYNLGRLVSYTTMGAAIGSLVNGLNNSFGVLVPEFGKAFSMLMAVVIAAQGFMLIFDWSLRSMVGFPSSINNFFLKQVAHVDLLKAQGLRSLALGVMTVFLPCMTLMSAFAAAAASGRAFVGSLILFGFGLGTLPIMIAVPILSARIGKNALMPKNPKLMRIGGGLILLIASVITVLRIYH